MTGARITETPPNREACSAAGVQEHRAQDRQRNALRKTAVLARRELLDQLLRDRQLPRRGGADLGGREPAHRRLAGEREHQRGKTSCKSAAPRPGFRECGPSGTPLPRRLQQASAKILPAYVTSDVQRFPAHAQGRLGQRLRQRRVRPHDVQQSPRWSSPAEQEQASAISSVARGPTMWTPRTSSYFASETTFTRPSASPRMRALPWREGEACRPSRRSPLLRLLFGEADRGDLRAPNRSRRGRGRS